ncbi:PucR family transcriptional regulator [Nocardia veterana]|uniref:PucR family transcriptional regulator n=1 Tax=Nocardia veterana TaxID=132249 RepID=A0A7X6LVG3_9NOCA|nr:helix-turn-helix domain-containing protein [Nocardia veterana]NKY85320.1 PucR family transcriptional regulator [Nocardia veterana]
MSDGDGSTRARLRQSAIGDPVAFAEHVCARLQREIPAYRGIASTALVPSIAQAIDRLIAATAADRPLDEQELALFRDYGALRAELGVPLEAMLRGWQIVVGEAIERIGAAEQWATRPGAALMSVLAALLRASDAATVAYSSGHRDAEAQITRRLDSRRDELVRALANATLPAGELRRRAQYLGIRLDGSYAAFRAITAEPEQTEWELRQLRGFRPPHGVVAILDGDVVGICDPRDGSHPPVGTYLGVGPVCPLERVPYSLRVAGRVAETARLFGRPGRHTLVDLGVLPAVVGDSDVGEALVHRYITPIDDAEAGTILATVDAYLASGLNASETGHRLYMHHNTVRYRLSRFEEITGASLKDPHVAQQVWWALRYWELGTGTGDS